MKVCVEEVLSDIREAFRQFREAGCFLTDSSEEARDTAIGAHWAVNRHGRAWLGQTFAASTFFQGPKPTAAGL